MASRTGVHTCHGLPADGTIDARAHGEESPPGSSHLADFTGFKPSSLPSSRKLFIAFASAPNTHASRIQHQLTLFSGLFEDVYPQCNELHSLVASSRYVQCMAQ